ncbi:hypothetical protein A2U01_0011120 [Trifolium medium]|uniref:Uncharacterized protein n=1 Tax=Trifolium medium TaxID=97028 RepID=A0A392MT78_9FABA|nr:hypothetical protein [Trifolium medium]
MREISGGFLLMLIMCWGMVHPLIFGKRGGSAEHLFVSSFLIFFVENEIRRLRSLIEVDGREENGFGNWDWVDDLSNTEATELSELEGVLQGIKPNLNEDGRPRWIAKSLDNFSVKPCYNIIAAVNPSEMLDHNIVTALNDLWLNDLPSAAK